MIVYQGDGVPPRVDKLGTTLHNGAADACMIQLPDDVHVLGRMVTKRSADALAIIKGLISPTEQEEAAEGYNVLLGMYQPVIRPARGYSKSKRPPVERQGTPLGCQPP